jgi:hypothetical protein
MLPITTGSLLRRPPPPHIEGKIVIVRCEINLGSGHNNPSWELTPVQVEEMFARLVTLLEVTHGIFDDKLDYRGVQLTITGSTATGMQSIAAHRGILRARTRDGRESWHIDRNRTFERTLFQTGTIILNRNLHVLIDNDLAPSEPPAAQRKGA